MLKHVAFSALTFVAVGSSSMILSGCGTDFKASALVEASVDGDTYCLKAERTDGEIFLDNCGPTDMMLEVSFGNSGQIGPELYKVEDSDWLKDDHPEESVTVTATTTSGEATGLAVILSSVKG